MKVYTLASSGERDPVEVEVDWYSLSYADKQRLYHQLSSDGGKTRIEFDATETNALIARKVISDVFYNVSKLIADPSFDCMFLQSPPQDADRTGRYQPYTPVVMVRYSDERGSREVSLGGVSTNELGDLLFQSTPKDQR